MTVEQIRVGLWRWTAPHPDWKPGEDWERDVACVYLEAADAVVMFDPLVPSDPAQRDRFWRALDRDVERVGLPVHVLLTVHWHVRSAGEVAARYPGAEVWAHADAAGRIAGGVVTRPFRPGDLLPGGVVAHDASRADEVVYRIPAHEALVPGDVLLGDGQRGLRLCPASWLPDGVTRADLARALEPILEHPLERVLVSHGEPVRTGGRAALERAIHEALAA